MDIPLSRVYPIVAPEKYKVHFACWNGSNQPLDVFVRSRAEWESWNTWRGVHDIFNRDVIFALIDFYPERHRWLFGGAYQVFSKTGQQKAHSYVVKLLDESLPYIGRLKVILKRPGRAKVMNLENYYHKFTVAEILPYAYTGEAFRGYDSISIRFSMLESIFAIQRADWKAALENMKGVYLITDMSNGKRYVGSAYGVTGIWSRWESYIFTGHGYNDELTNLIGKYGLDYARQHFRFALLEQRTMKTDDLVIIQREKYWKDVLLTREPYGYNKN